MRCGVRFIARLAGPALPIGIASARRRRTPHGRSNHGIVQPPREGADRCSQFRTTVVVIDMASVIRCLNPIPCGKEDPPKKGERQKSGGAVVVGWDREVDKGE